jgi:hypothetical protein
MKKSEAKKLAKYALKDYGIKAYMKDMANVTINELNIKDYFAHRRIYRIEMINGTVYEVLQETVDGNNKFSMGSAKYKTCKVREF